MTAVLTRTRTAPPSTARIALARVGLELRLFSRERQQVVFSFAYPVVMLVIFSSVLGGDVMPGRVSFPQYFLAGIAATGIMLSSFQALGTSIATEREVGQLERLQLLGTPPVAYFAGKAGQVLATTAAQLAILLPVARYAYDVPLPVDLAHWVTFGWVAVLSALAGTVLGIAVSALPGTAKGTVTAVSAFAIVLQFFSGVFFALPEQARVGELAGTWEHGRIALVLAAWVIIGAMVCVRTFRWRRVEG